MTEMSRLFHKKFSSYKTGRNVAWKMYMNVKRWFIFSLKMKDLNSVSSQCKFKKVKSGRAALEIHWDDGLKRSSAEKFINTIQTWMVWMHFPYSNSYLFICLFWSIWIYQNWIVANRNVYSHVSFMQPDVNVRQEQMDRLSNLSALYHRFEQYFKHFRKYFDCFRAQRFYIVVVYE